MKAAIYGILGAWLVVGALCAIGWVAATYPMTSLIAVLAIAITVVGALIGLSAKDDDLGDYYL